MGEKLISLLKSRRFWAALVGLIVVIASQLGIDIDPDKLLATITLIASWIISDGLTKTATQPSTESRRL